MIHLQILHVFDVSPGPKEETQEKDARKWPAFHQAGTVHVATLRRSKENEVLYLKYFIARSSQLYFEKPGVGRLRVEVGSK